METIGFHGHLVTVQSARDIGWTNLPAAVLQCTCRLLSVLIVLCLVMGVLLLRAALLLYAG